MPRIKLTVALGTKTVLLVAVAIVALPSDVLFRSSWPTVTVAVEMVTVNMESLGQLILGVIETLGPVIPNQSRYNLL